MPPRPPDTRDLATFGQALYGQFGRRPPRYVPFLTGSERGTFGGRPRF